MLDRIFVFFKWVVLVCKIFSAISQILDALLSGSNWLWFGVSNLNSRTVPTDWFMKALLLFGHAGARGISRSVQILEYILENCWTQPCWARVTTGMLSRHLLLDAWGDQTHSVHAQGLPCPAYVIQRPVVFCRRNYPTRWNPIVGSCLSWWGIVCTCPSCCILTW